MIVLPFDIRADNMSTGPFRHQTDQYNETLPSPLHLDWILANSGWVIVTGHWKWWRLLFPGTKLSNVITHYLIDPECSTFSIGMKAVDSFMFHYLWNVYSGIKEQPHITGWYSPFNHPPPPPAPHPCNHVSSYIIAFQLLTGVWPLPPNMPNLIHVFPKRQRDALFW